MKIVVFLLAALVLPLCAAPKNPEVRQLDSERIQEIEIHSEVNTLLIFPSKVDLIVGAGLTDGSIKGSVQYQQPKDARMVLLRQLGEAEKILIHITCGEEVYPFRLQRSDEPSSVIRFETVSSKTRELNAEEAKKLRKKPSKARQLELMRLASSSATLQKRIPDQYAGFEKRSVELSHEVKGLKTVVKQVAKFENERAIILLGEVHNLTRKKVDFSKLHSQVYVGFENHVPAEQVMVSKPYLTSGEKAAFQVIILGDRGGDSDHISVDNPFRLSFRN